jgi:hypothetical protein
LINRLTDGSSSILARLAAENRFCVSPKSRHSTKKILLAGASRVAGTALWSLRENANQMTPPTKSTKTKHKRIRFIQGASFASPIADSQYPNFASATAHKAALLAMDYCDWQCEASEGELC